MTAGRTRGRAKPVVLPIEDQLLRLDEAAAYFSVGSITIKRWADSGKLRSTRTPAGHRRVYLTSVLEALEAGKHRPLV